MDKNSFKVGLLSSIIVDIEMFTLRVNLSNEFIFQLAFKLGEITIELNYQIYRYLKTDCISGQGGGTILPRYID